MILLFAILSNVLIAVIFKMFARFSVDNRVAISINYFVCFALSCLLSGDFYLSTATIKLRWFPFAVLIAVLFIITFNLIAFTVQKVGISITSIFQRLSLIFPVILGFGYFNEQLSMNKLLGLCFSFIAIVLMIYDPKSAKKIDSKLLIVLPLGVWILSGINEMCLLYAEKTELIINANIQFVGTIFLISGCIGLVINLINRSKIQAKSILAGIVLGVPNFFSIYLILELLSLGWDGSIMFPILNISILILSGLIGYMIFSEKLNKIKILGFIMGLTAIVLISI